MIKTIKVKNITVQGQATYHYKHHRMIGITFTRMEGMTPTLLPPTPIYYAFTINLWKYVIKFGIVKEKND